MLRLNLGLALSKRTFTACAARLKKTTAHTPASAEIPGFDADSLKKSMENTLSLFQARIKVIKAGQATAEKFSNLDVELGKDQIRPLKTIAAIAPRGNKINIVAFDPKQVKHIQTAIVGQMGMPAELSKNDKQTLSVLIPPDSATRKEQQAREIKDAFDFFRNNAANRSSLSALRHKVITPLKKSKNGSTSELKKLTAEVESITKTYQNKLQELLNRA